MSATDNLVSIGELLNFNKNRIDIGSYSVVSPVAEDALDYYNYYLLDSTFIDSRKVYKLEVEPKNQADALVEGNLLIADSTYDVVDVDFGFNEGVRIPFVKNLRYRQHVAQFENLYWMPVELRFTADIEIKFPGVPDGSASTWRLRSMTIRLRPVMTRAHSTSMLLRLPKQRQI